MRRVPIIPLAILLTLASAGSAAGQSPSASPSTPAASPPATSPSPVTAEAVCGPLVTTAELSAALGSVMTDGGAQDLADRTAPDRHVSCTWALEPGELTLEVDDASSLDAHGEAVGGTPVTGLGTGAFAGSSETGAWLAWTVATEGGERLLVLRSDVLGTDQLAALAAVIRADAAPAEVPQEPATEPETIGDPADLAGTWKVTGTDFGPGTPPWPVTLTFTPEGELTIKVGCKPPKGAKAPLRRYRLELISTTDTPAFNVSNAKSPVIRGCRDGNIMEWTPLFEALPSSPAVFFVPDATGGVVEIWVPGRRVMTITRA